MQQMIQPQDYLEILERGVPEWNAWRSAHPDSEPDLSELDLGGSNRSLRGVNFSRTNLFRTDFQNAQLEEADLTAARFEGTNLSGACLQNAQIVKAHCYDTCFECADLTGATVSAIYFLGGSLVQAKLSYARFMRVVFDSTLMEEADFASATFDQVCFMGIDMTRIRNANPVCGSIEIGIRSLWKSKGGVPHEFLANSGIPSELASALAQACRAYYSRNLKPNR